jgi:hypothetical protein
VRVISLFGGATRHKSRVVTSQRRLNCYYDNRPDQDKTKVAIYGTPGLVLKYSIASALNQPMRAMAGTDNSFYTVAYNQFLNVNPVTGATLNTGTLNTFSGHVEMAISPTQVVVVDGNTGYLYTIATGTFVPITPWQATSAQTVTFVSGFFVAEQPGTQNFWVSDAFDGSTWSALAFAAAAADSDTILAVDQLNGNLIVFMTQGMEFWLNQGLFPEPFVPLPSAANTFGLAAIASRVHADQALLFLAESTQGIVQAARLDGYNVTIISDSDMEAIWNSFAVTEDAVGLTYQRDAHIFYQLTFPTANRSFLYDCSTRLWSEVQTGASVTPARHSAQLAAYTSGQMLLSDAVSNQIYTMSDSAYTDNGATIIREIVTKHLLEQFNRVRISLLYLDMETGVGLQTGQGSAPMIMLQSSKDNGRTWSAERWVSLGAVGTYLTRVIWRRFGSARDYVFKIRMSDPVKFVITEGAIKISERAPVEKLG